ncbi:MAG: uracil-DNA glycosylase [Deltaproteobacteria bacterium]|nr:uracil-DNA glycosylase [Deltaproteobacteria bacterium]
MSDERKVPQIEPSWLAVLGDAFDEPYMLNLRAFLVEEKRRHEVYPPGKDIFAAFWATPFDKVRVVILGQDPYHDTGQAHGLCFSVRPGVAVPRSLHNIFKEIESDLGIAPPDHGCLLHWAHQGVLLINTVLTVRAHAPASHAGKGWESFTDRVIVELNRRRDGLVFALWGAHAKDKARSVDRGRHTVLTAAHPSPLSAASGFFGCRHFSKINAILQKQGTPPIDWGLPRHRTPLG